MKKSQSAGVSNSRKKVKAPARSEPKTKKKAKVKKLSTGARARSTERSTEIDSVTGLPTVDSAHGALIDTLRKDGYLGLILIDLSGLGRIEREHGHAAYDAFLGLTAKIILDMRGSYIRNDDQVLVSSRYGEQILIVLSAKRRGATLRQEDMELVGDRVYNHLLPSIMQLTQRYFSQSPQIDVGYSFIIRNPMLEPERILQRLLHESRDIARSQRYRFAIKHREQLKDLILNQQISTLFQPIVHLDSGKILGFEALSRGPKGTIWESPAVLFSLAQETDLSFELDRLCRRLALERTGKIPLHHRVFINSLPVTLRDPEFRGAYLKDFLKQVRLSPKNIVLEMTESLAVEEYETIRQALSYYRDVGFAIAIDDAGTGYANLETIMQLKPDFIKIDLCLIRDIGKSVLKRELVKALQSIATTIEAQVVAEGIEQESELSALRKLGITYGQGFLLGRPAAEPPSAVLSA